MTATTAYPIFENKDHPIELKGPSKSNRAYESPASASKPFEMASDAHSRYPSSDANGNQVNIMVTKPDKHSAELSRSNSPFLGTDRKSLFSSPAVPKSNTKAEPNVSLRGQFLDKPTTRPRSKSFTEKAVDTLAAPISLSLVLMCASWYTTSVVSNTLNKTILTVFPYPVTLTMIQFLMAVCMGFATIQLSQISRTFYRCLPAGTVSLSGFRYPTREIIMATLPMGIFQLFGHIFSHMATSLIPVSLVHTIKALSPLFTVAAYRFVFGVKYPARTYWTLIPLTTGVILTCSTQFSSQMRGILYALIGSLIFVSQNIYSKKLLTHRSESNSVSEDNTPRIDKLNILCYCSSLAFIFTSPLWLFSEGFSFLSDYINRAGVFAMEPLELEASTAASASFGFIVFAFLMNGVSHFLQNMLAFQILGMVSPVTYSVASLVKRIAVVTVSILWFGQRVSGIQQFGIVLTFGGLYIYDRLGGDKVKQKKYTNISLRKAQPSLPK